MPEFQALLDAITRNDGVFQPPLITVDFRVLEGNRRVTALKKLHAADARNAQWRMVTVHQLGVRIPAEQERALRAKFHLENALPWDSLSQLTEYLAVAERDGPDLLATMVGKFRPQIEPLIVAGRAQDIKQGAALAAKSIDSGEAEARLDRLIAASNA